MFPETILQMNNGATVMELSNALEQVVAAVRAAGKSGSILRCFRELTHLRSPKMTHPVFS